MSCGFCRDAAHLARPSAGFSPGEALGPRDLKHLLCDSNGFIPLSWASGAEGGVRACVL